MRVVLRLECIGDDVVKLLKQAGKALGGKGLTDPWVARITGLDNKFGFCREFVNGEKDYSLANSVGSRGVYLYFALSPGIYEVFEKLAWKQHRRFFIRVENDTYSEISKAEITAHFTERSGHDYPDTFPQ